MDNVCPTTPVNLGHEKMSQNQSINKVLQNDSQYFKVFIDQIFLIKISLFQLLYDNSI